MGSTSYKLANYTNKKEQTGDRAMYDWRKRLLETNFSSKSPGYRIGNCTIRFQIRFIWLAAALGCVLLIFFYVNSGSSKSVDLNDITLSVGSAVAASSTSYNYAYPLSPPVISNGIVSFKIAVIADMDTNSRTASKDEWKSFIKHGFLSYNSRQESVAVNWDEADQVELVSHYSHKGRGMECSELVVFNGRLLTVDDRTGIIFEISKGKMLPWIILTDGDGNSEKGFKSEWATVKGEHLYVGSMGKEWTSSTGEYLNDNPMFVKRISPTGQIEHINWTANYKAMRKAVGIEFPGYLIHESGMWSAEHHKWYFLPRRCSTEKYDEKADEHMGCNVLIVANSDFSQINVVKIGLKTPQLGYSSFKFLPNSKDNIIIALKTVEVDGKTATYVTVFTVEGKILLSDQPFSSTLKFEGLEFV